MNIFKNIYFGKLFYSAITCLVFLFIIAYFEPPVFLFARLCSFTLLGATFADISLLFIRKNMFFARRELPEKMSNGDNNEVKVFLQSFYSFSATITIIDEIPFQFQVRDFGYTTTINAKSNKVINYTLRPVKRGEYQFGSLLVYVHGKLNLVRRRFTFDTGAMVPVYPSIIQMQKYEFIAISENLTEYGIKRLRKIGQSMEFESIREYVLGDDPRSINWTATARKTTLMVNHYRDEKSQQIYCVIDKGRTMQMPFEGLSLLDYSINASLALSNIALKKQDKAGLITFSDKMGGVLPADNKRLQLKYILDMLYNQKTKYLESDYELLYSRIKRHLHQRALLVLFANFGSLSGLKRQLPYLRRIGKSHLLVVVFFKDTELDKLLKSRPEKTEDIYIKAIAEQFTYEKKIMVKELESVGIHSILVPPAELTVGVINKYLELKARRLI